MGIGNPTRKQGTEPKTYKHEAVTIINEKDKLGPRFTFKGGPNCQIVFDSVRLWKCEE